MPSMIAPTSCFSSLPIAPRAMTLGPSKFSGMKKTPLVRARLFELRGRGAAAALRAREAREEQDENQRRGD